MKNGWDEMDLNDIDYGSFDHIEDRNLRHITIIANHLNISIEEADDLCFAIGNYYMTHEVPSIVDYFNSVEYETDI